MSKKESFRENMERDAEKIWPEANPKFDTPHTRHLTGWEGKTWRIKPPMTREEYNKSPATMQYPRYEAYLGGSSYINYLLDMWAWERQIRPAETVTETIRDVLNIGASYTQKLGEKRPPKKPPKHGLVKHLIQDNGKWKEETYFEEVDEEEHPRNAICLKCVHLLPGKQCNCLSITGYPPLSIPTPIDEPIFCTEYKPKEAEP